MTASIAQPSSPARIAAAPELANVRVLLIQEWLYTWAGSERCVEQLAGLIPHADVLAAIVTPEMRRTNPIAARARESWVGKVPGARKQHRWFLPLHALAFSQFDTTGYDLIISVSHAFGKSVRARRGTAHLSYCLTPPRYLWDMRDAYSTYASPAQRLALGVGGTALRMLDRGTADRVTRFVSISNYVADRVKRCYGRDSAVVYPPVTAKVSSAVRSKNGGAPFLLSLGRLVPYKRVDLAILAAERLRMKLIVAGDGPERKHLESIAGRFTEFAGAVSENDAARLLSGCAAFVFCAEEDFGIAPVEANAHGAPVVAYGRGGAVETMREGKTGVFFADQTVEAVTGAIERCLATAWDADELRRNAERFSPERFREGIRGEIAQALRAV